MCCVLRHLLQVGERCDREKASSIVRRNDTLARGCAKSKVTLAFLGLTALCPVLWPHGPVSCPVAIRPCVLSCSHTAFAASPQPAVKTAEYVCMYSIYCTWYIILYVCVCVCVQKQLSVQLRQLCSMLKTRNPLVCVLCGYVIYTCYGMLYN